MRELQIAEGEHYHVFNRGMHKHNIFNNNRDYLRFLFLILHFQSPLTFDNLSWDLTNFAKTMEPRGLGSKQYRKKVGRIVEERTVELVAFALMPNHFHLVLKEIESGGISFYMQRVQNSFTKYSNTKNKVSGHLFQGPYKIVHIDDNDQLLYTSAYIHRNCREIKLWQNKEESYPWSSYQDYVKNNRLGNLLADNAIREQFPNIDEYKTWVETSGAKDGKSELKDISQIEN